MSALKPSTEFVCESARNSNPAPCQGEDFYREFEGKRYCVFHHPERDKAEQFSQSLRAKLNHRDFNFCGFSFPERVSFTGFEFDGQAIFSETVFNGGVDFSRAKFDSVDFTAARFVSFALFGGAVFWNGQIRPSRAICTRPVRGEGRL